MFPPFPNFPGFPQTTGRKRVLFSWDADFELPVKAVREEILSFGIVQDASVDVLIAAVADVVGETAARLDLVGDGFTLEERLHSFCQRVEQTYKRRRLELKKQKPSEVDEKHGSANGKPGDLRR